MKAVVLCAILGCCVAVVYSSVPVGFQPIPPLPGQNFFGGNKTPKPKPTLKPTPKTTKFWKPTQKPVVTKAPPIVYPPSTPAPKNCQYNINVPQANCNGGNSAVQQTLNDLKLQLDKTRQQHQAQNSAVQSLITKLQGQQAGYLSRISDLQNEVRNLILAFNSLNNPRPSSSTVAPVAGPTTQSSGAGAIPSAALLQAIQNVRHDMGQTVNDFNSKLLNLTLQIQANQLQDSQLHTQVEAQIQGQSRDIGRLTQQVTDLNRILQQLNSISGAPSNGSGATSAEVAKLKNQIQQVDAQLKQYDAKQLAKLNTLNQQTASLQSSVAGHTSDISNLKSGSALVNSRINIVQKNITVVHDSLAQFRQTITPKMNRLTSDVSSLTTKTNKLDSDAKQIGKSVGTLAVSISTERGKLKALDAQTQKLKNETKSLQKSVTDQGTELLNVKLGLIQMKNIVPDLKSMNNVILNVLNKGGNPSQSQLKDVNNAINKMITKLSQIKLQPASG